MKSKYMKSRLAISFLTVISFYTLACSRHYKLDHKGTPYQVEGDSIVTDAIGARYYKTRNNVIEQKGEYRLKVPTSNGGYEDYIFYNGYLLEYTEWHNGKKVYHHVSEKIASHFKIKR